MADLPRKKKKKNFRKTRFFHCAHLVKGYNPFNRPIKQKFFLTFFSKNVFPLSGKEFLFEVKVNQLEFKKLIER